jgi:hypothetical protein
VATSKLEQAIGLIKTGQKTAAHPLLIEILREQPQNDTAWLWMAAALREPEKQREALQIALQINPNNETAKKGLARMGGPASPPPPLATVAQTAVPEPIRFTPTPATHQPAAKKTPPFVWVAVVGGVAALFLFYLVVTTFSNPAGNTASPSGSGNTASDERAPGTFYLWYNDRPFASVPVVSQIHENVQGATRDDMLLWALKGEACLAEPGTLASFAATRAGKAYVTIQEGKCSGVTGWVPDGVFHDKQPPPWRPED